MDRGLDNLYEMPTAEVEARLIAAGEVAGLLVTEAATQRHLQTVWCLAGELAARGVEL